MNSKGTSGSKKGLIIFVVCILLSIGLNMFMFGNILSLVSLLVFLIVLAIYFIPAIVAGMRNHAQETAIILLNLFLGWTFVGWVIALIWAVMNEKKSY